MYPPFCGLGDIRGGTMRKKLTSGVLTVVAVLTLGWQLHAQTPRRAGADGNVRAAIEAANKKFFMDAAPKADVALLASVYTDDAIAYPANADAIKGRAALQAMWKSVFDSGISGFELTTQEVEASGDTAWETGTYAMK